ERGDLTDLRVARRAVPCDLLADASLARVVPAGSPEVVGVVPHDGEVVAGVARTDGVADEHGTGLVGVPRVDVLAAVASGQEEVLVALADVDPDGAPVVRPVDGIAAAEQGTEPAVGRDDRDGARVAARGSAQLLALRVRDRGVG